MLVVIGEGDNIRFVPSKLWDEKQRLEGQCASKEPLPVTLKCAGHTGTHLQSYGDKPGTSDITETNRETPENYLKGTNAQEVPHGHEEELLACADD